MARIKGISANLNAFLDTLAVSEGTVTNGLSKDDGYDVIVTGIESHPFGLTTTPEIFSDYHTHPFVARTPKQINLKGLYSTASGRYQFMLKHWAHYKHLLGLLDFGPKSQDLWAIQLIRETRALPLIEAGKFREAVALVAHLWASLPGANYKDQKMHSIDKLEYIYLSKGGKLWEPLSAQSLPQLSVSLEPTKSVPIEPSPKPIQNTESLIQPKKLNAFWTLITSLLKRN